MWSQLRHDICVGVVRVRLHDFNTRLKNKVRTESESEEMRWERVSKSYVNIMLDENGRDSAASWYDDSLAEENDGAASTSFYTGQRLNSK